VRPILPRTDRPGLLSCRPFGTAARPAIFSVSLKNLFWTSLVLPSHARQGQSRLRGSDRKPCYQSSSPLPPDYGRNKSKTLERFHDYGVRSGLSEVGLFLVKSRVRGIFTGHTYREPLQAGFPVAIACFLCGSAASVCRTSPRRAGAGLVPTPLGYHFLRPLRRSKLIHYNSCVGNTTNRPIDRV
jgi:hypothetical protein